jgi:hypothetical protein
VRLSVLREGERVRTSTESAAPKLLRQAIEKIAKSATVSQDCTRLALEFVFDIDESWPRRTTDSGDIVLESPNRILIRAAPFPLSGETTAPTKSNRKVPESRY